MVVLLGQPERIKEWHIRFIASRCMRSGQKAHFITSSVFDIAEFGFAVARSEASNASEYSVTVIWLFALD